jgi:acyl-CoA reductase-like NAD-dependent aldehyde dehydrogenase
MRVARDKIFGPVITVIPYRDENEAMAIANDPDYGLAGSVWTADTERALRICVRIPHRHPGCQPGLHQVDCGLAWSVTVTFG